MAPDGAEKSEFAVQTGALNCDSNPNSPKNQAVESFVAIDEAVGPGEIILREDASTNTREDTTVIFRSDLDKMQSDLRALTEALSAYQNVQKADASLGVCELAFGLSVLPAKELSLMKDAIKRKIDVVKCEAETCTDDQVKVLPKSKPCKTNR